MSYWKHRIETNKRDLDQQFKLIEYSYNNSIKNINALTIDSLKRVERGINNNKYLMCKFTSKYNLIELDNNINEAQKVKDEFDHRNEIVKTYKIEDVCIYKIRDNYLVSDRKNITDKLALVFLKALNLEGIISNEDIERAEKDSSCYSYFKSGIMKENRDLEITREELKGILSGDKKGYCHSVYIETDGVLKNIKETL